MTQNRIGTRFAALASEGRAGLIPFIMAGDPDEATTEKLLAALPGEGADFIELGIAFSDPMADGPSIQAAGRRALDGGATLAGTLRLAARFRTNDENTPLILMGYFNPILQFGPARFAEEAAKAGVDGVIIVDLPPEEAGPLTELLAKAEIDPIRFIAPTTDRERFPIILDGAGGFLYLISIRGVTGTGEGNRDELAELIKRIRPTTPLPVAIGFGVRTPEQAAEMARLADAVVMGSALVDLIAKAKGKEQAVQRVCALVREAALAIRKEGQA